PKSLQQTTHMSRMVADPKLFADHFGHPLTGPHISPKAVSLGSLLQKLGHLGALLLAEAGPCSRGGAGLLSLYSPLVRASPLHPLAYRSLADAQGLGYALLGPSLLLEFEGSQTPSFAPVGGLF